MKVSAFAGFLDDYQIYLGELGMQVEQAACAKLKSILLAKPSASVSDVCKSLKGTPVDGGSADSASIGRAFAALLVLMRPIAKKALVDDVALVVELLQGRSLASLAAAAAAPPAKKAQGKSAAVDQHTVDRHLQALESALRDETSFKLAFAALKADKLVKLPEAKAIAREFSGETAKTKPEALQHVWKRHSSLLEARAKEASRDGRSAA